MSCKGRVDEVAKPGSAVSNSSKKCSLNLQQKRGKSKNVSKKAVVVAVRASREISRTALVWALTHVVQPGDSLTLIVVVPTQNSGKKLWGFPLFAGDCAAGQRRSLELDMNSDITDTCSEMMLQLHDVYDPNDINLKIKIVSGTPAGAVAAESKRAQAGWVILDKQLKQERRRCMEALQSNIVMMKRSQPKVLRLNLVKSPDAELKSNISPSSPDLGTPFTHTEAATSSISSSDPATSPFLISDVKELKKCEITDAKLAHSSEVSSSGSSPSRNLASQPWVLEILDLSSNKIPEKSIPDRRNPLPGPPPICSICQHKTPPVGKPPRWFTYAELALATGGFSESNFLAEGGFGSVHRGILPDGQRIAVKQHKLASSQGDLEFCAEVEVLSCAQHRNVVMLLGFCVEDRRRLLVYEYVCNGSLDSHLYGCKEPLEWAARQKIAVGAARGLRYLHEECRVGCVVHRDVRPNNILLTHDFEPLVGDFGLARWQADGSRGVETRVIGTFGYLAPEYIQSGQITDKADVFSFGVVLLELVSGRKAIDIDRPTGQQCLSEWARPMLEENAVQELVDPRLGDRYSEQEASYMLAAASLCLRRDPHSRPRMAQVLRILEGGDPVAETPGHYASTPRYELASQSARLWTDPNTGQLYKVNRCRAASCEEICI